jgi:hypothetical protein
MWTILRTENITSENGWWDDIPGITAALDTDTD